MRIRKTIFMNYLRTFSAMITISDRFILSNGIFVGINDVDTDSPDLVTVSNKINGVHKIKSIIEIPEMLNDAVYISSRDIEDQINTLKNITGIREIDIIFDEVGVHVICGEKPITIMTRCFPMMKPQTLLQYDGIIDRFQENFISMGDTMLDNMRMGKIVVLSTDTTKVRISKTQLPLIGPVRSSGPINFKIDYHINDIDNIIFLKVQYKYFEALHIYTFQSF